MSGKYSYLKQYVGHNDLKGTYFLPVSQEDIGLAEEHMNGKLPSELRCFYEEIGQGILSCGEKYPEMFIDYVDNIILPPRIAVDYMLGIIQHSDDEYYMSEEFYKMLEPGDLPFFETFDSCRYLLMKPFSDTPNAVWYEGGIKIEDSFEKFIWRLYYESPTFYEDIIEEFDMNQEANSD